MLLSGRVCTGLGKTLLVGWIKVALIVQYSSLLPSNPRVTLVSVPLWLAVLSNQLCIIRLGRPLPPPTIYYRIGSSAGGIVPLNYGH